MTLQELATGAPEVQSGSHRDRIIALAWWLHCHGNSANFSTAEMRGCYDALHLPTPGNLSQFLSNLAEGKNPALLKSASGYRLALPFRVGLDKRLGARLQSVVIFELLEQLPARISLDSEKVFLEEVLKCLKCGANRAAIVMAWNLAFDHFLNWLISHHLQAFNTQLPKSFQYARISCVSKKDDFGELQESQTLQVAKSAGLITADLHRLMTERLGRRNSAAHPSSLVFGQLEAESAVSELIQNVVLKLQH